MTESRIVTRSRCNMDARIVIDAEDYTCVIHDLSVKGARLELTSTASLPENFAVDFAWRSSCAVKKRWQCGPMIGVEFVPSSIIDSWRLARIAEEIAALRTENKKLSTELAHAERLAYCAVNSLSVTFGDLKH